MRSVTRRLELTRVQVGMQAEDAKKPGPGAGLCPGYTISRAILADAISLTRGDRFYTTDFTRESCASYRTLTSGSLRCH